MNTGLCKTCSTPLQGKYCYKCGEKVVEPEKDYSLKHHTEEFFDGFFHLDNKVLKSLKLLITRPAFLTEEYLECRRVKYVKPLHIFLVLALVLALLPARMSILSQDLNTMLHYPSFLINKKLPAEVLGKHSGPRQR
jgi:hypothetical protein